MMNGKMGRIIEATRSRELRRYKGLSRIRPMGTWVAKQGAVWNGISGIHNVSSEDYLVNGYYEWFKNLASSMSASFYSEKATDT